MGWRTSEPASATSCCSPPESPAQARSEEYDGYKGLAAWSTTHPNASPLERAAEAKKLRASNWKAMLKELDTSGVTLKSGERLKPKYTFNDKLEPLVKQSGRYTIPATNVTLVETCVGGRCSLTAERGEHRLKIAEQIDVGAIYAEPKKGAIVIIARDANFETYLTNVSVFSGDDLQPVESARKEGATYALSRSTKMHSSPWLIGGPHWAKSDGLGMWCRTGASMRYLGPDSEGRTAMLHVAAHSNGQWLEGWVHPHYLSATPLPDPLAAVLDLKLEGAVEGHAKTARYRVIVKHAGAVTATVPKGRIMWSVRFGGCDTTTTFMPITPFNIEPGKERELFVGYFEKFHSGGCMALKPLDTTTNPPEPLELEPAEFSLALELDGVPRGPTTVRQTVQLPMFLQ